MVDEDPETSFFVCLTFHLLLQPLGLLLAESREVVEPRVRPVCVDLVFSAVEEYETDGTAGDGVVLLCSGSVEVVARPFFVKFEAIWTKNGSYLQQRVGNGKKGRNEDVYLI